MLRNVLCCLLLCLGSSYATAQLFPKVVYPPTMVPAESDTSMRAHLLRRIKVCEDMHFLKVHAPIVETSLCYESIIFSDCNWEYLPDSLYVKLLMRLSVFAGLQNKPEVQEHFKELAGYFVEKTFGKVSLEMADYYRSRGSSTSDQQYHKAIIFLDKSNQVIEQIKASQRSVELDMILSKNHVNLGWILFFQKKWDEAAHHLNIAAALLEQADPNFTRRYDWFQLYITRGQLYLERNQLAAARADFEGIFPIIAASSSPKHVYRYVTAFAAALLAETALKEDKFERAIQDFRTSGQIMLSYNPDNRWHALKMISGITAGYTGLEAFAEAERQAAEGLEDWHCHLGADKLASTHDLLTAYGDLLHKRSLNYKNWYEQTCADSLLYLAHHWNKQALTYITRALELGTDAIGKGVTLRSNYAVFEGTINLHYLLFQLTDSTHYVTEALKCTEFMKNIQLQAQLGQEHPDWGADVPPTWIERSQSLQLSISNLQFQRHLQAKTSSSKEIDALIDSLRQTETAYRALLDSISIYYPAYFQVQYPFEGQDIAEQMTQLLGHDHTVLNYFVGTDYLFSFLTRNGQSLLFRQDFSRETLFETSINYTQYLADAPSDLTLNQTYISQGEALYDQLIRPVAPWLGERVLVLPDDELIFLPFEALPVTARADETPFYLIQQHSLSYAYSLSVLQRQVRQAVRPKKRSVLAFAPNFWQDLIAADQRNDNMQELRGTHDEARYISSLYPSRLMEGEEATLRAFKELAPHYQVIHLATHAKTNFEKTELSYLAFSHSPQDSQWRLYEQELSSMHFEADMVVLSACETAHGQWDRGAGPLGLARAFTLGGARSTVTTLWNISDRESAQLMGAFYTQLAQGLPKDEALRQAKLRFLSPGQGTRMHPYYWSAYIIQGNAEALRLPTRRDDWLAMGLLVGLLAAAGVRWWYIRRRSIA